MSLSNLLIQEIVKRWWDELNACMLLRGGIKIVEANYPGLKNLLTSCANNKIDVKFSLPELKEEI